MKKEQKRKIADLVMQAMVIIVITFCGVLTIALVPKQPVVAASSMLDIIDVNENLYQCEYPARGATTLVYQGRNEEIKFVPLVNVTTLKKEDNVVEKEVFDVENSRSPSMSAMNEEETETEEHELIEETEPVTEVEEEPTINHDDYYFGLIEYTEKDLFYVAAVIYAESRGEPYTGKVGVGATVVNRYMDPRFPNNFYKVITQEDQFANISWVTKEMIDQVPECWEAAIEALNGVDPTFERTGEHALYFFNPAGCSQEALNERANIKNECTIGAHVFYRNW